MSEPKVNHLKMEKSCDSVGGSITSGVHRTKRKLNTKGCCFLCLTVISSDAGTGSKRPPISLKILQRHFRINRRDIAITEVPTPPVTADSTTTPDSKSHQDIEAELCKSCTRILCKFKDACISLEKAQMELNYWSGRVHHQISEGSRKPEQIQYYSKRMANNGEGLGELIFVDNLRMEIASKSLTVKVGAEAKICLHQLNWKFEKRDQEHDENNGDEIWSQSEPDHILNEDIDFEEEQSCHTLTSMHDNDSEVHLATIPTIKIEKPDITARPPSPSEPETTAKLVPPTRPRSKMYVKHQKTGIYSCTSCNKKLTSRKGAERHYETIHLGKRFTCQVCKSQFTQKRTHMKSCNGKKRKSFSRLTVKKWNFNSETGKYACASCGKEFLSNSGVYRHYDAIHLKKKHKCEICKVAEFFQTNALINHKKTCEANLKKRLDETLARESNPELKFSCSTCGKRFERRVYMENHFRNIHTKERNHSCSVCGKKFFNSSAMKLHRDVTHFGKKFNCKICKREYRSKRMHGVHEKLCAKKSANKN